VLLHDLKASLPFARNVADSHRSTVRRLYRTALTDAGGSFPQWILDVARNEPHVPGCSALAATE